MKKKIFGLLLLLMVGMFVPNMHAYAADMLKVTASSPRLKIGDTVTITAQPLGPNGEKVVAMMTFEYDKDLFSLEKCSDSTYGGGYGTVTVTGESTAYIVLKALGQGSDTIKVTAGDYVNEEDPEKFYPEGDDTVASTKVEIVNAALAAIDPTDPTLSELKLSDGTLSPDFKGDIHEYTVTVPNEVTRIDITAKPKQKTASVSSVTGNENLQVGENIIKIVVKAENGVTAEYTITVTREPEEDYGPIETFEGDGTFLIDGKKYGICSNIPEELMQEGFYKRRVQFAGERFVVLQTNMLGGEGYLFYLCPQNADGTLDTANGRLTVYDVAAKTTRPYILLSCGNDQILVWKATEQQLLPGYVEAEFTLDGIGTFSIYSNDDELPEDFSLIYAKDHDGKSAWYRFDRKYGTYQRYVNANTVPAETLDQLEQLQSEKQDLEEQLAKLRKRVNRIILIDLVLVSLLILTGGTLVIIYIIRRKEDDGDDDGYNGDNNYDDDYEEPDEEEESEAGIEMPFIYTEEAETPDAESMTDETEDGGKKRGLFGIRKKRGKKNEDDAADEDIEEEDAAEEAEEDDDAEEDIEKIAEYEDDKEQPAESSVLAEDATPEDVLAALKASQEQDDIDHIGDFSDLELMKERKEDAHMIMDLDKEDDSMDEIKETTIKLGAEIKKIAQEQTDTEQVQFNRDIEKKKSVEEFVSEEERIISEALQELKEKEKPKNKKEDKKRNKDTNDLDVDFIDLDEL